MTTGRPTTPARHSRGVVLPADQELSGNGLLLEVALQAKRLVPFCEHAGIDRAVRFVTGQAAFP